MDPRNGAKWQSEAGRLRTANDECTHTLVFCGCRRRRLYKLSRKAASARHSRNILPIFIAANSLLHSGERITRALSQKSGGSFCLFVVAQGAAIKECKRVPRASRQGRPARAGQPGQARRGRPARAKRQKGYPIHLAVRQRAALAASDNCFRLVSRPDSSPSGKRIGRGGTNALTHTNMGPERNV